MTIYHYEAYPSNDSSTNQPEISRLIKYTANIKSESSTSDISINDRLVTMWDFLPVLTADYDYTLDISPHKILPMTGDKSQLVHKKDNGSISVYTISSQSYFDVEVTWDILVSVDYAVIFDLWHNPLKANGMGRTFYWEHPLENLVYTARFMSKIKGNNHAGWGADKLSMNTVTLRLEGRKAV